MKRRERILSRVERYRSPCQRAGFFIVHTVHGVSGDLIAVVPSSTKLNNYRLVLCAASASFASPMHADWTTHVRTTRAARLCKITAGVYGPCAHGVGYARVSVVLRELGLGNEVGPLLIFPVYYLIWVEM